MKPIRDMSPTPEFDTNIYFGVVARNLLANLGERALPYSEAALTKMRAIRDDEGFELWQGIYEALLAILFLEESDGSVTIH